MIDNISNPQLPMGERLERIESLLTEILAAQQQGVSQIVSRLKIVESDLAALKVEIAEVKQDAKERYNDLRSRTELNNDKLSLIMRELNQIAQDIRHPRFTVADTR